MSEEPKSESIEKKTDHYPTPVMPGIESKFYKALGGGAKPKGARGLVFETEKQRNQQFLTKGITKPGRISYEVLRRAALSVHVARICVNTLKSKVTKTPWVIQPIDQTARSRGKTNKQIQKQIEEVTDFFKHPNLNDETFRTLLDKMVEDLLVLDAVSLEKTRYPDGTLAELHFIDSSTIRPVFDEYGNQDVLIELQTKNSVKGSASKNVEELPVSYLQIFNNSQYGGPESGDIVAAWPKKDFIHFHAHPQGSVDGFGYGLSPLEGVLSVISGILDADNYNASYFQEGSFPPVILQLVGQIDERQMDAFREYMMQELSGAYHRPAIAAGPNKVEVINLKSMTNNDMQFMEYSLFMAKLCCAAFELSPQDIGITDDVNRATAEVQKNLSEGKGYGSVLHLIKEVFNQEIIWKDFGYDEIEFEWVADDSLDPEKAAPTYKTYLESGILTPNEVRQKIGEAPYGKWGDKPMILTASGYQPIVEDIDDDSIVESEPEPTEVGGEANYKDQKKVEPRGNVANGDKKDNNPKMNTNKSMSFGGDNLSKAFYTTDGFKTWMDDRGYSQPFIFQHILSGKGFVIKPPVAVNFESEELEVQLSIELKDRGLNVPSVSRATFVDIMNFLSNYPMVRIEFDKYMRMTPEYDSEKWKAKFGHSREFDHYLVQEFIYGSQLNNPLLIANLKRDPESYLQAIDDLAKIWLAEKELVLGDRRADQYIITPDKRAWGFDYQFMGNESRWQNTSTSIQDALKPIPMLEKLFLEKTGQVTPDAYQEEETTETTTKKRGLLGRLLQR